MNEKTRSQIENMKKQTIGVEIEMNNRLQKSPQSSSEQTISKIQQPATATTLGVLGMHRAENGNSKRMSALQAPTAKSANW